MVHALSHLWLHTWGGIYVLFMLAVCSPGSHWTSSEGRGFCQSRLFSTCSLEELRSCFWGQIWEAYKSFCKGEKLNGGLQYCTSWWLFLLFYLKLPLIHSCFLGVGSLYRRQSQILISGSAFKETLTKTQAPASGDLGHSEKKPIILKSEWGKITS